jgi:hypothetical protein
MDARGASPHNLGHTPGWLCLARDRAPPQSSHPAMISLLTPLAGVLPSAE